MIENQKSSLKNLLWRSAVATTFLAGASVPFVVDPQYTWRTDQFGLVTSREIPTGERLQMGLRTPGKHNDRSFPIWAEVRYLDPCNDERERDSAVLSAGIDDKGKPFLRLAAGNLGKHSTCFK